jgi:hypothetical protein
MTGRSTGDDLRMIWMLGLETLEMRQRAGRHRLVATVEWLAFLTTDTIKPGTGA